MTIKAINVRNQFKGTIKEIVITTRSVKELELVVGSEVIAFVKSTEVSIAKL
jgi:molybdopterin-binding protein